MWKVSYKQLNLQPQIHTTQYISSYIKSLLLFASKSDIYHTFWVERSQVCYLKFGLSSLDTISVHADFIFQVKLPAIKASQALFVSALSFLIEQHFSRLRKQTDHFIVLHTIDCSGTHYRYSKADFSAFQQRKRKINYESRRLGFRYKIFSAFVTLFLLSTFFRVVHYAFLCMYDYFK